MQETMMRKMWIGTVAILVVTAIGAGAYGRVASNTDGTVARAPRAATTADTGVQVAQNITPRAVKGVRVLETDRVLGKADAPVAIFEYASLTCPHCARFHTDVLPRIKEAYVDTGKVKLIYRDFPLDRLAFTAAVLARCNQGPQYFSFLDALFRSQSSWSSAKDPISALRNIARLGGIQPAKFDDCLNDKAQQEDVSKQRFDASRRLSVNSTPSLIINGNIYGGGMTFEQFKTVVDPLLAKS